MGRLPALRFALVPLELVLVVVAIAVVGKVFLEPGSHLNQPGCLE